MASSVVSIIGNLDFHLCPLIPEAALGRIHLYMVGAHRASGWGPGPAHLPILVPQCQQHWPVVALHLPVQVPQTEAIPGCTEGQTPGMSDDSWGEVEAELETGLEVSKGSSSSSYPPSTISPGPQKH